MTNKIASAIVAVALSMMMLTGCNTIRGVGKDIESGGKAIQKSTDK